MNRSSQGYWSNALARGYLVLGLASCLILSVCLNARRADLWAIIPPFVGAVGLAVRWPAAPVFVLLGTAIAVMQTHPSESIEPEFYDILMSASLLVYSVAQSRLVGITRAHWPPDPRPAIRHTSTNAPSRGGIRQLLLAATVVYSLWRWFGKQSKPLEGARREVEHANRHELTTVIVTPALALASTFVLWRVVQLVPVPLNIVESHWRLGFIAWTFIIMAILARVIISTCAARRMSPEESVMVLNDIVWRETRREQIRAARWTAWKAGRSHQE